MNCDSCTIGQNDAHNWLHKFADGTWTNTPDSEINKWLYLVITSQKPAMGIIPRIVLFAINTRKPPVTQDSEVCMSGTI